MYRETRKTWKEKLTRSGFFFGAVLFHLLIFLLVAAVVIFHSPPPPPTEVFHGFKIALPPPPPPQPPSSGDEANNPQFEPEPVVVPVVTPPAVITAMNNAFKINTPKIADLAYSQFVNQTPQGTGLTSGSGNNRGTGNGSGDSSGAADQFTGYFYDFNQTKDKTPTGVDYNKYVSILSDYINQNWDDSVLEPYYRSKTPISMPSFFASSTKPSADAPKNFGLENEVLPNAWIIHYHAKVIPPSAGDYRFLGFADNVLIVKINGEPVFDGGWTMLLDRPSLHKQLPWVFPGYTGGDPSVNIGNLKMGASFHVEADEPVDIDVFIGDGGEYYNFFLLIKNENEHYESLPDGTPLVPFFQLGDGKGPTFSDSEPHVPYSETPEPWHTAPQ